MTPDRDDWNKSRLLCWNMLTPITWLKASLTITYFCYLLNCEPLIRYLHNTLCHIKVLGICTVLHAQSLRAATHCDFHPSQRNMATSSVLALKRRSYERLRGRFKDGRSHAFTIKDSLQQGQKSGTIVSQCDRCCARRQLTKQQTWCWWSRILARWRWFTYVTGCVSVCFFIVQTAQRSILYSIAVNG